MQPTRVVPRLGGVKDRRPPRPPTACKLASSPRLPGEDVPQLPAWSHPASVQSRRRRAIAPLRSYIAEFFPDGDEIFAKFHSISGDKGRERNSLEFQDDLRSADAFEAAPVKKSAFCAIASSASRETFCLADSSARTRCGGFGFGGEDSQRRCCSTCQVLGRTAVNYFVNLTRRRRSLRRTHSASRGVPQQYLKCSRCFR